MDHHEHWELRNAGGTFYEQAYVVVACGLTNGQGCRLLHKSGVCAHNGSKQAPLFTSALPLVEFPSGCVKKVVT